MLCLVTADVEARIEIETSNYKRHAFWWTPEFVSIELT